MLAAEVLRLYEDTILEVEQHMEEDPAGGLPDMQYQLAEMQVRQYALLFSVFFLRDLEFKISEKVKDHLARLNTR